MRKLYILFLITALVPTLSFAAGTYNPDNNYICIPFSDIPGDNSWQTANTYDVDLAILDAGNNLLGVGSYSGFKYWQPIEFPANPEGCLTLAEWQNWIFGDAFDMSSGGTFTFAYSFAPYPSSPIYPDTFTSGGSILYTVGQRSQNNSNVIMFQVPTSTADTLTASVSSTLADPGMLAVLGVVIGIPFAFYVIKKLISLVPKR